MSYYIMRNSSNAIVGLFTNPQPGFAEELLPDSDAAVEAFLKATAGPAA